MSLSFRAKEKLQDATVIYLVRVYEGDDPVYAYVAVRADVAQDFIQAMSNPPVMIHEWGYIILKGPGENPPPAVEQWMQEHYDVKPEGSVNVIAEMEAMVQSSAVH